MMETATSQTPLKKEKPIRQYFSVPVHRFIILVTFANMLIFQWPMYLYAVRNSDMNSALGVLIFALLLLVVFMATVLLLSMISLVSAWLLKLFLVVTTLLNACAFYFMFTFRAILDLSMMSNIYNTRQEESLDFLSMTSISYFLLLGVLPACILIFKIKLQPIRRLRVLVQAVLILIVSLVVIYSSGVTWLWFDKHSKQLGGQMLPWSYVINSARYLANKYTPEQPVKLLPVAKHTDDNKLLVLLVVGEAARAQNFSLYGYNRETNPQLGELDIAVLKNAVSCSTYTKASLHCMLSHDGSSRGNDEPLPSYLQRIGVDVFWRTKNWGEPPIDVREYETAAEITKTCTGEHCSFDDILLSGLEDKLNSSSTAKTLIALHTKGSHGPSYFERYPPESETFKPVCKTVELDKCTSGELLNAYDNTLVYTDSFLTRAIERLAALSIPSVLIYASDHGESLGESGVYLHGTPYAIAPDEQKHIPFLVWMSEDFKQQTQLTTQDVANVKNPSHSHVFHSVLGALGLQSEVYDPSLDIFKH